jgi:hypothetical protein
MGAESSGMMANLGSDQRNPLFPLAKRFENGPFERLLTVS